MPFTEEKLAAYTSNIISRAEAEAKVIREETTAAEEKALSEFETHAKDEAASLITEGKIAAKSREETRIAAESLKNRRRLLEYRESCAGEVFAEVQKRVEEFTSSDGYSDKLLALLSKAAGIVPGIKDARIFLRRADMKYKDTLAASLPGIRLEFAEGSFSLGGLMLVSEEKSRRIDLTFDSAFADLSGRFSEITGFRMED